MITSIEALNFRCLRYVNEQLDAFNVLVGANASGKTTFLDVISFIRDVVSQGPEFAIKSRTDNIYDLFWERHGNAFELAIEAAVPSELLKILPPPQYNTVRYELKIGVQGDTKESGILGERLYLKANGDHPIDQRSLFPREAIPPQHIYDPGRKTSIRNVIHKIAEKNDNFYSELYPSKGKGWVPSFKFGTQKSALGNLPDDGSRFPVSTWLRQFLTTKVQNLILNGALLQKPSPPAQPTFFKPDGSNLPWVIQRLEAESPQMYKEWIRHIRTALPDIQAISTVEREEDRHRYIIVRYDNGIEIPSWMVSDGTLRFLALTLLAYLSDFDGLYLIEEPENGIHPRAVEPVLQSLSSMYDAQVLLATHSPVILGLVDLKNILCFAKEGGATDIVRGTQHPALQNWQGEASLGMLFAAGVLG